MRVFIVRPFGQKEGIDFEEVERALIQRALTRLRDQGMSIAGDTTEAITRAGNIREDMFRLLVISDLVIADVSIHNANAFYELGVRHALRPRATVLIRSETAPHKYPFDLQTDRYLLYSAADPAGEKEETVSRLAEALRSTLATGVRDSPIFLHLPKLTPHGRGQLVSVPAEFKEAVDRARRDERRGDLRLLAHEVQSFEWDQEGLRLVGDAQFSLRANAGARETFERLRDSEPGDFHANRRLGTVYQRLAATAPVGQSDDLLVRSDQAATRALENAAKPGDRAEAFSLLGSNEKTRWITEFMAASTADRRAVALRSPRVAKMLERYLAGAGADLNAHYPAINALALLRVQVGLARALPEVWADMFDDDESAEKSLETRELSARRLEATLALALETDEILGKRDGVNDPWAESSRADLLLMTNCERAKRVGNAYRQVLSDADHFTIEATARNLNVFRELGLFEPGISEAVAAVAEALATRARPKPVPDRVILFTGHMIDTPERRGETARFPPTARAEETARRLIEGAVRAEIENGEGATVGIAGGASGGDILFHEVCRDLGVETELFLALPRETFQVTSVQRGLSGSTGTSPCVNASRPGCCRSPRRSPAGWRRRTDTTSGSGTICGCCSMPSRWMHVASRSSRSTTRTRIPTVPGGPRTC